MTQPTASSQAFQKQLLTNTICDRFMGKGCGKSSQDSGHCDRIPLIRGLIGRFVLWQLGFTGSGKPALWRSTHASGPSKFSSAEQKEALKSIQDFFDSAKNKHWHHQKSFDPKKRNQQKVRSENPLNGKEWKPYLISTRLILKASPLLSRLPKGFWMWSVAWKKARCL